LPPVQKGFGEKEYYLVENRREMLSNQTTIYFKGFGGEHFGIWKFSLP
jgi:hypothetical protein